MADDKRLGRGLGAIFGDDVSNVLEDIQQGSDDRFGGVKTNLKIKDIRVNPYQPRRHFDDDKIAELANSIRIHGLFTPILVRETSKGYELVAGERRLRASKTLELEEIAAIVVNFDDEQMMEIALIENVQREDLSVIEEAMAYQTLIEKLDLTQDQVAKRVSKSRSHITNLLRLLRLPDSVKKMVAEDKLSMGHARPLIMLEDDKLIEEVADEIISKKLSAREAERIVKDIMNPSEATDHKENKETDYSYAVSLFEDKLQTRIEIKNKKLSIHFNDDDDLNRIMEILNMIE
ncbi:ParB/RepB/Spo0J family partition protein [Erysipelothrix urinaevulpis]|uniref:ParB/RepB/Spo0J family partition protein n=1 Tax=Erysipelothrix urinaevulpis TaxID=2683717 RepID=UPI001357E0D4|nr:ParB/RepB/Spo0J family partition protein [Erysipelothrix urinaevulpis]